MPTMTESGIPMSLDLWWGVLVPAATPDPIVAKINQWFNEIISAPETKKFLNDAGADPMIRTPEEAQKMFLTAIKEWGELRALRQDRAAMRVSRRCQTLPASPGGGAHGVTRPAPGRGSDTSEVDDIAMRAAKRHLTGQRLKPHPPLDRDAFVRPIAHRGWHDEAQGRLENTAPAFRAAIAKGYGIECDLQGAEDGTPMVFHDAKLDRLVAASGPIAAHSPRSLARLRYKGQDERILTFAQLLDLVGGRVPMLVEVKRNGTLRPGFLEGIARQASAYKGPLALMSFDRGWSRRSASWPLRCRAAP